MTKEQKKYADNVVKYNVELYNRLIEFSNSLGDEEEAEKYVKFLTVSSAQECLFKVKEVFTHCKQLFNTSLEIPVEIETLLKDIKPAFNIQDDKLMNVSGMEINEMITFIKDTVAKNKANDGEGSAS